MRVSLIGYYGKNFGDLLMLQGILSQMPIHVTHINILSYSDFDLNSIQYSKEIKLLVYNVTKLGFKHRIKLYRNCDYIIWGGGSCFNDVDGTGAVKQMLLAKVVNPRIKIQYLGIGIDCKNNKLHWWYLKLALILSDTFNVRDQDSYRLVSSFTKVTIGKDPIYYNEQWFATINDYIDKNYIMVSYRNVKSYFPNQAENYLNDFIENLIGIIVHKGFTKIYIFDCDQKVDKKDNMQIYKALCIALPKVSVIYKKTYQLDELCSMIKKTSLMITGRLHAAVVCNLYCNNFLLLNYSKKNESFMKEIGKLDCLINYSELQNNQLFNDKLQQTM